MSAKKASDLEQIYCLTREAMTKSAKVSLLEDYHNQKQLMNKFTIGQVLLSEPVLDAVRKVLKKMGADSKVDNEEIRDIIANEIIKRELLDADKSADARKKVTKALKAAAKPAAPKETPAAE